MRVTAIQTRTERKRQDRSVRCAEKHLWRAKKPRVHGLNRPVPAACATADATRGEKNLSSTQIQAMLTSVSSLLGECRIGNESEAGAVNLTKLSVDQAMLRARVHVKKGEIEEAKSLYETVIAVSPNNKRAKKSLEKLNKPIQAVIRHPPQAQLDVLIALYNQGNLAQAVEQAEPLTEDYQTSFLLWNILGVTKNALGLFVEAQQALWRAIEIKPDYADAYNNMGKALKDQGKLEEAIASYQKALKIKPDYAAAYNNMGNALKDQGKLEEAIASYRKALKIKPDHALAYNNMGNALKYQGKLEEAIAAYQRALDINPDYVEAQSQMLHQLQHICDFERTTVLSGFSATLGIDTNEVSPFAGLSWADNSEQQLARSRNWAREKFKHSTLPLPERQQSRPARLKVGYFSSDFHDHATMFLMAGLLRDHDHSKFEISAYSYGRTKLGDWRKRAEQDVDHFFDVADLSHHDIVDLARTHRLDVAVDLKGYTAHNQFGLFKYRLAPIQINYLGYPGSLGAEFIDYIIADPVVIPLEQRQFYSEKVIYLPHSYQPNDDAREIAQTITTRADFGLPEEGFVFCCFNNSYKISPREFDIWMQLLSEVERSVLWLINANKWAAQNLLKEAEKRGIDPLRLVFARRVSQSEHLARHKHADLFLDTFNVNAHTTASDALWAGLPVVTKQGNQFAARVAASLLTAVGLPELITTTEEAYKALILELATNGEKLAAVKETLDANRLTHPLFDTKRYTRDFEAGLTAAFDLYFADQEPQDIWVRKS